MRTKNALLAAMTSACVASGVLASGVMTAGCARVQGHEASGAASDDASRHGAQSQGKPVKAETVARVAPPSGIRYSASIEAFEQVPLSFKSAGYVDGLLRRAGADGRQRAAQPGDVVAKGTVLARVREAEYRERVSQGRAGLAEAEAGVAKARLDLDRAKTLFAADSLTKPELDAAQASFDAGQAKMAAARADLELAAIALRDCALVSPANGVLLERRVESGALVGSGTVGFVVGDISAVKARFGIPDAMIQSLKLGESIDLSVEAIAGTTFKGHVTGIAPAADAQSRVFDVEVTIQNRDGRLRPGMIGTVAIRPASAQASAAAAALLPPAVPLTAIVRSKAGTADYAAFIVERRGETEIARLRQVQLGEVVGNAIIVTNGITTGDRVIVTGASLLVDGEPVHVLQ